MLNNNEIITGAQSVAIIIAFVILYIQQWRQSKVTKKELTTNGGSSMKDQVNSMHARLENYDDRFDMQDKKIQFNTELIMNHIRKDHND